jgi:predicted HicB family RNase H-like nuclease
MEIRYKGFVAEFFFFPEANAFCGEVLNSADLITFQAGNPQDALEAMQKSVDCYLSYISSSVEKAVDESAELVSPVKAFDHGLAVL